MPGPIGPEGPTGMPGEPVYTLVNCCKYCINTWDKMYLCVAKTYVGPFCSSKAWIHLVHFERIVCRCCVLCSKKLLIKVFSSPLQGTEGMKVSF